MTHTGTDSANTGPAPTPARSRALVPAVFLDRDGTVIPDSGYLGTVEGVELLPGAATALAALRDAGFVLVIVTNQSGIGRGYYSAAVVEAQHARLADLLAPAGVRFVAMKYCPHLKEAGCTCRKPLPGMLLEAAGEHRIDLSRSWMIGDRESDVGAGRAAGCRAIHLVVPGVPPPFHSAADEPVTPDHICRDLPAAVAHILAQADAP